MQARRGHLLILLLAVLVGGCSYARTRNASRPRYWLLPFGDVVRPHAKPGGFGANDNFDPDATRLEVQVSRPSAPVRSRQVIIATVTDNQGRPLRNRRVDWMLEGVGNIIEVDESGLLPGRGGKVDNDYAFTQTALTQHTISRFNGRPNEDFVIRPGQTWCVVSAAEPGKTQLTVWTPNVANWDENRKVATLTWTSDSPLSSGEPIEFGPPSGPGPRPPFSPPPPEGIPPADPGVPVVPGMGASHPRHVKPIPEVALFESAPSTASVGQTVPINIQLTNSSVATSKALTVRAKLDPGLQVVRSDPPASQEGKYVVWTLSELPARTRRNLKLECRPTREGPLRCAVDLRTGEGIRDDKTMTIQILPREKPGLQVSQQGPTLMRLSKGESVQSETVVVFVSNPGTGPATSVKMRAELVGLTEARSGLNTVESDVGTVLPGATIRVPLQLRARRAGEALCRVTAESTNGMKARSEHKIQVQDTGLELKLLGPTSRAVGKSAVWNLVVTNTGAAPLENVMVSDILPRELTFVSATENGTHRNGEVLWRLGTLPAQQTKRLQVTTTAKFASDRVVHRAFARGTPTGSVSQLVSRGGRPYLEVKSESLLTIQGYSSLRMTVEDREDPVVLGGTTQYRVVIQNEGSKADSRVQVVATLPMEMRLLRVSAPTSYRQNGQQVTFTALPTLGPGQSATWLLEVQAVGRGDARFRAEMSSATLVDPIFKDESTNIP